MHQVAAVTAAVHEPALGNTDILLHQYCSDEYTSTALGQAFAKAKFMIRNPILAIAEHSGCACTTDLNKLQPILVILYNNSPIVVIMLCS
jgi:hypothetical protein